MFDFLMKRWLALVCVCFNVFTLVLSLMYENMYNLGWSAFFLIVCVVWYCICPKH